MNDKRPPGRPPFEPTEQQRRTVRAMSAYGIPQDEIALVVGCSGPTLRKYFWREIEVAQIEANAKVAQTLFAMATDKDHPKAAICAMFWLKCRARWTEQPADQPGKKQAAEEAAREADRGTGWESLLN